MPNCNLTLISFVVVLQQKTVTLQEVEQNPPAPFPAVRQGFRLP